MDLAHIARLSAAADAGAIPAARALEKFQLREAARLSREAGRDRLIQIAVPALQTLVTIGFGLLALIYLFDVPQKRKPVQFSQDVRWLFDCGEQVSERHQASCIRPSLGIGDTSSVAEAGGASSLSGGCEGGAQ